jgi:hypothetical protein
MSEFTGSYRRVDSATDNAIWDDDVVRRALAMQVRELDDRDDLFRIVEFGSGAVTIVTVSRDSSGTPQATVAPLPTSWIDPEVFYAEGLAPRLGAGGRLIIVASSALPDSRRDAEVRVLRARRAGADFYHCASPAASLLRQVVRDSPITRFYELVLLAEKRGTGRLVVEPYPLFAPGATRGDAETFGVRCVSGGPRGTVFAVVARDVERYSEVSLRSVALPPGRYTVTAVLDRPGRVDFEIDGQLLDLKPERRRLNDIVTATPWRVERLPPAHLVCLIETSGTTQVVMDRIDRLGDLIGIADTPDRDLRVSVVSYGPHSFDRREQEGPVCPHVWLADPATALMALSTLRAAPRAADEYSRAAQLECALTALAQHLDASAGRPVLVTAGSRPPHPPRADLGTRIIPCPQRQDWRPPVSQLAALPGITFGAFRDQNSRGDIWEHLGRNAMGAVSGTNTAAFAAALGLTGEAPPVPFPLAART